MSQPQMSQPQWTNPAPEKRMSTTKIVLLVLAGVMALVFAGCTALVVGVGKAVDDEVSGQPKKVPGKGADDGKSAALGRDTVKLNNGLEVAPAIPEKYSPDETAASTGAFNYKVQVTFANNGEKDVDLNLAAIKAATDGGATKEIVDSANNVGMLNGGTLAPGQTTKMTFGFSTEKKPTYVNVDVTPGLFKTAHFTYKF
ncbi:DUF4352 domain-containing protein [Streptomyces sp. L500]|uniref:hypothetical protein n=1 Tax=Streptomyces abikoensis TaxID=97398 RepID=UPI0036A006DD